MVNKVTCALKLKSRACGLQTRGFGTLQPPVFGHQRTYSLGVPTAE